MIILLFRQGHWGSETAKKLPTRRPGKGFESSKTISLQNSSSFWPAFILINWSPIHHNFAQRHFSLCIQSPLLWLKLNSSFMFESSGARICSGQTQIICTVVLWRQSEDSVEERNWALPTQWDSAEGCTCLVLINLPSIFIGQYGGHIQVRQQTRQKRSSSSQSSRSRGETDIKRTKYTKARVTGRKLRCRDARAVAWRIRK